MTPVAQTPIAPGSRGSRLLTGLLVIAVVGLAALVVNWPEPPPDTQPPTSPGALSAGETTCKSISLSWAGATDDRDVTRYEIYRDGQLVTSGGRVLTVVGRGATFDAAIEIAYRAASHIRFEGMQFRRDIGRKAVGGSGVI